MLHLFSFFIVDTYILLVHNATACFDIPM